MNMKRNVVLAVALLALMAVGAFAQDAPERDFMVTKSGNAITIVGYNGGAAVVNIPSRIQNLPVTVIQEHAFDGKQAITSVTIPSSVTTIGNEAITNCGNLVSVTFQGTIPASGIHATAFRVLGDLRAKYIAGGIGTYTRPLGGLTWTKQGATTAQTPASQYAPESDFEVRKTGNAVTITQYFGKGGAVNIPATIQGSPVTTIGEGAFSFNNPSGITSVIIPNSVTTIDDQAFVDCMGITSITIPASVTTLGANAFQGCAKLTSVTFAGTIPASGFKNSAFIMIGDLRAKYLAGGAGTYTQSGSGRTAVWTKK